MVRKRLCIFSKEVYCGLFKKIWNEKVWDCRNLYMPSHVLCSRLSHFTSSPPPVFFGLGQTTLFFCLPFHSIPLPFSLVLSFPFILLISFYLTPSDLSRLLPTSSLPNPFPSSLISSFLTPLPSPPYFSPFSPRFPSLARGEAEEEKVEGEVGDGDFWRREKLEKCQRFVLIHREQGKGRQRTRRLRRMGQTKTSSFMTTEGEEKLAIWPT